MRTLADFGKHLICSSYAKINVHSVTFLRYLTKRSFYVLLRSESAVFVLYVGNVYKLLAFLFHSKRVLSIRGVIKKYRYFQFSRVTYVRFSHFFCYVGTYVCYIYWQYQQLWIVRLFLTDKKLVVFWCALRLFCYSKNFWAKNRHRSGVNPDLLKKVEIGDESWVYDYDKAQSPI